MGKLVLAVIVAGVGYAWYSGWIFAPRKAPQRVEAPDRAADIAARLQAERERMQAEENAAAQQWQPASAPARPGAGARQFPQQGPVASSRDQDCATARNNVQVTQDWMRQGGTVVEKNSQKRLSANDSFDAAARNRQFIADNCGGR